MKSQQLVAILRAKGIDTSLHDLPACPGSHVRPVACVTMPDGDLLSIGREDDYWTRPDEDLGEALHMQTGPGYDDDGRIVADLGYDRRVRIWSPVNSREVVSIAQTFGRRLPRYAAGQVVEYTSFDSSGYSVGQVVRYAGKAEQDTPADLLVYIRAHSGGKLFPVRESQLRARAEHDGHVYCAAAGCVLP
jgi:hypothetical protein